MYSQRRRIPYRVRLQQLAELVNKKGGVTVDELVALWSLEPSYVKRIIRMALAKYKYLAYDSEREELFIRERKEEAEK